MIVQAIQNLPTDAMPEDSVYRFRLRARRLVKHWRYLIDTFTPERLWSRSEDGLTLELNMNTETL